MTSSNKSIPISNTSTTTIIEEGTYSLRVLSACMIYLVIVRIRVAEFDNE